MPTVSHTWRSPADILTAYKALPRFAKILLQLCAVAYEPVDISSLLRCLYKCGLTAGVAPHEYARKIESGLVLLQERHFLAAGRQCHPAVVEIVTRQAVREGSFHPLAKAVRREIPSEGKGLLSGKTPEARVLRDLRLDLYGNDIAAFHKRLIEFFQGPHHGRRHPIVTICNTPFSADWIDTLPDHLVFLAIHEILADSIDRLLPVDDHLRYLRHGAPGAPARRPPVRRHPSFLYLYLAACLLRGDMEAARQAAAEAKDTALPGINGWRAFVAGRTDEAIDSFRADLAALQGAEKGGTGFFPGFEGTLYFLARLRRDGGAARTELGAITARIKSRQPDNRFLPACAILHSVAECLEQNRDELPMAPSAPAYADQSSITCLFMALAGLWVEGRIPPPLQETVEDLLQRARNAGYRWLAMEFAQILHRVTNEAAHQRLVDELRAATGTTPLLFAIDHEEPWQKALKKLRRVAELRERDASKPTARLVWLVETDPRTNAVTAIHAREQKMAASGGWSKGRAVSLRRLAEPHRLPLLTDQDKKICAALRLAKDSPGGAGYYFDLEQALWEMIGHPLVFRHDDPGLQIDIRRKDPELHVNASGDDVAIYFTPFPGDGDLLVNMESRVAMTICRFTRAHRAIAEIIGKYGLTVPRREKDQILTLIGRIAVHLNIHSDFDLPSPSLEATEPDTRIRCRVLPSGSRFQVSLQVKPFGHAGPYLPPGHGASVIITEIQGKMLQARRDLDGERRAARAVEEKCPTLMQFFESQWEYILPGLEHCLNLLLELRALGDAVVVEWPKGEHLRIQRTAGAGRLYVKIRKHNDWFAIDGSLRIDEDTVLGIRELLDKVKQSGSRFIPLSGGQFLALTKEMYKCLDELGGIARLEDGGLRVSPLAAPILSGLTDGLGRLEADSAWMEAEKRIREAQALEPRVPDTLRAELRNYQQEGFRWLARLAYMGAGACLADEMGLGKTVQALALILDQAPHGPCLVVAPTSVCPNWISEAQRFCPTLNIVTLGLNGRARTVRRLKKMDLLVTSYGLLQHERELLAEKQWRVIILDEAQAIKNMNTKRSKAAMGLHGRFKMITTGTPIENNLGELWNLFHFINPGLLGSINQFNRRYAAPIERDKQRQASSRLKGIIGPFILRRLKSQVLDELPPRTEVNLHVELNDEERALYESLRRDALDSLEREDKGNRQIRILAEIMRLRRACCNPDLVAPELGITSSKLTLFEQLIGDLLANRHKILVFSQFVDHLTIIRRFLDSKGISHQYLDGSTPPRRRKQCVDAFQAGEGDVFLISLRAGGLGLNLTAANYVIHMDPWWNPAVEDQASDRAHRIGQKNPVTIYRMITKGTIEEKIVTLHREKRELADNLLQGTDIGGEVGTEELLRLLRDE